MMPRDALVFAAAPERRRTGRSRRDGDQVPRRRKLTDEPVAAVLAEAGNRSLRELSAAFGVSHETVRAALREDEARPSGEGGGASPRSRFVPRIASTAVACRENQRSAARSAKKR